MPHWQPAVIFLYCLLWSITANKSLSLSLSLCVCVCVWNYTPVGNTRSCVIISRFRILTHFLFMLGIPPTWRRICMLSLVMWLHLLYIARARCCCSFRCRLVPATNLNGEGTTVKILSMPSSAVSNPNVVQLPIQTFSLLAFINGLVSLV